MLTHPIKPLPEGCPWSGWDLPNIKWCEANLCSWITTPANTWSNLAYLLAALVIAIQARQAGPKKRNTLNLIAVAQVAVGVTSFLYHASYTRLFQLGDFVGMYAFSLVPITLNFRRMGLVSYHRQSTFAGVVIAILTVLTHFGQVYGFPIQQIVMVLIVVTIAQEIALVTCCRPAASGKGRSVDRTYFVLSLIFLVSAGYCSYLDLTNQWCDPDNHNPLFGQAHATWHVLSATSLLFLAQFYQANFWLDSTADVLPLLPRVRGSKGRD